jgi:hypothetical protein
MAAKLKVINNKDLQRTLYVINLAIEHAVPFEKPRS